MRVHDSLLSLAFLTAALALGKATGAEVSSLRRRDQAADPSFSSANRTAPSNPDDVLSCRLVVISATYPAGTGAVNTSTRLGCIPLDANGLETSHLHPIAALYSDLVTNATLRQVADGTHRVAIRGASVGDDGEVSLARDATVDPLVVEDPSGSDGLEEHGHRQTAATGTKSLYVVRVSTPDSSHPKSLSQIVSALFSTSSPSFKSQYQACSFGKLMWTSAGGMDVTLDNRVAAYTSPSQLADAAIRKVEARIGRSVSTLADKIVFCQPPGTSGWIAVAVVNGWRVNVSSGFCLSLSTLMHEVGHTLGLLHSGEGSLEYGDETGYMGYGYASATSPKKCFNGYKSYQLGWYSDRILTVDPSSPRTVKLATFVDYPRTTSSEPVVVSVMGSYFLQYNRAKGMNAETKERANAVTVTQPTSSESLLAAGLVDGGKFTKSNFRGTGKTLYVVACDRRDGGGSNGADVMVVSIGYGRSYC